MMELYWSGRSTDRLGVVFETKRKGLNWVGSFVTKTLLGIGLGIHNKKAVD
jgi:hypothetical protein